MREKWFKKPKFHFDINRKTVIIAALIAIAAAIAVVLTASGDDAVEFNVLSEAEIPQDITGISELPDSIELRVEY